MNHGRQTKELQVALVDISCTCMYWLIESLFLLYTVYSICLILFNTHFLIVFLFQLGKKNKHLLLVLYLVLLPDNYLKLKLWTSVHTLSSKHIISPLAPQWGSICTEKHKLMTGPVYVQSLIFFRAVLLRQWQVSPNRLTVHVFILITDFEC